VIGGLVVLAPQRFVAKRSSAMKIAHFYLHEKILVDELSFDAFLSIGKFARDLGLY
jgi:hypothetical protein